MPITAVNIFNMIFFVCRMDTYTGLQEYTAGSIAQRTPPLSATSTVTPPIHASRSAIPRPTPTPKAQVLKPVDINSATPRLNKTLNRTPKPLDLDTSNDNIDMVSILNTQ